jgi:hypothetical protein
MRWIKHPSNFSRSAAMCEVRETLGPSGYGAFWMIVERIAENFEANSQETMPGLCISEKEWRNSCGLSAKKLHDLLEILKNHGMIFLENAAPRYRLTAPFLLRLQDESTRKARKNSGIVPESRGNDSGPQQTEQKRREEKDNRTGNQSGVRAGLHPVLARHGIFSDQERANRIIRHIERKNPNNPGGYLESILQRNPGFDPHEEGETTNRQQGPKAIGDILRNDGWPDPANGEGGQ